MSPLPARRLRWSLVLLAPLLLSSCFTMMVWGFEPDEECDRWGNLTMVYDPATEWTWDRVGCRVLLTPPAVALDVLLSMVECWMCWGDCACGEDDDLPR